MKTIQIIFASALFTGAMIFSSAYSRKPGSSINSPSATTPPAQVVTLFRDKNFGGASKALYPGAYTQTQLGIGNDALSSIKIADGYAVVLYQNDSGNQGKTVNINNSVADLNTLGFDNIASMVFVFKIAASLYSGCNFSGKSIHLPENRGNGLITSTEFAFPNDLLSSVKVAPGKMLRLFSESNLKGKSIDITSNVSCLSALNFNDIASSWMSTEPLATVYDNCNFTGSSKQLGFGPYPALDNNFNNRISSIKLTSPFYIELYDNTNLGSGLKVTITGNTSCLPANINNKASSLHIGKPVE